MSSSISGPRRTASASAMNDGPLARMFQCVGGNQSFAAPTLESAAKDSSHCLMVFCAGSNNFNGMYTMGAVASEASFSTKAAMFRKVDSSETLVLCKGWWLFNEGSTRSGDTYYGVRAENAEQQCTPPKVGWHVKHGQSPPPRVQCFKCIEEVPWQLQDPGMLERSVLDVACAGSADFNGSYTPCGVSQGKLFYHKVGSVQMISFHKGWWLMNAIGKGESFYGFRSPEGDHVAPPDDAAWIQKAGQAPAPRVQSRTSQAQLPGVVPVEKELESLEKTNGQQETSQQVLTTALPVGLPTLLGFRAIAKEAGKVVMRDVNELSKSCSHPESLSNEALQQAAGEHGVDSLQIELGKAEACSIGFTDDAAADNYDLLSKDLDVSSKSSEAKSVRDSVGSSNEVVLGVEEADTESAGEEGIASMDQEEVHAKDECAGPLANAASSGREESLAEHADAHSPPQLPQCAVLSTVPTAAISGQEGIWAEHANAQRPPQPHCGVQDTMPDSDEVKELRMPIRGCDSFRSEADEMPCTGFVSQRVSSFAKLSSSRSQSFPSYKDAPDRGFVSERIRAHQRFISGAAPVEERAAPVSQR